MSFNKVILIGNVGQPPKEVSYPSEEGKQPFCHFTLAINEARRDNNGELQTLWYRVTVFGRRAEIAAQYLFKGKEVYIEGRQTVGEWTDREGQPRYTLEVLASEMQLLGDSIFKEAERLEEEAIRAEQLQGA